MRVCLVQIVPGARLTCAEEMYGMIEEELLPTRKRRLLVRGQHLGPDFQQDGSSHWGPWPLLSRKTFRIWARGTWHECPYASAGPPSHGVPRASKATGFKGGWGALARRTWESTGRFFSGGNAMEIMPEVLKTSKEVSKTPNS